MPKKIIPPAPPTPIISDDLFGEISATLNTSIHELVYAHHHLENDDIESSLDALTLVASNVESIQQKIIAELTARTHPALKQNSYSPLLLTQKITPNAS
jgi:predicted RecB family endonuclease